MKWHDVLRRRAQPNEAVVCCALIKNGKYYVAPPNDGCNFKVLFSHLAATGAGRPVDGDGVPEGPWTPELLAEAISLIDADGSGVDLRTVQFWFQDNDKGIRSESIRWLARIFGCGDPDATSEWQAHLSAAKSRLLAERRARRGADEDVPQTPSTGVVEDDDDTLSAGRTGLAVRTEGLFSHESSLNLPVFVLAGSVTLGFIAYVMGVHSVTYMPRAGLEKQVGFLWAPNWTILNMVLLPLYLIQVIELLTFWKGTGRLRLLPPSERKGWAQQVDSFSQSYWTVLFICAALVFLVQWSGVYLRVLLKGDAGSLMMDWTLIAVVRPDVISEREAIVLTFLAFLYTAACVFLYLVGLVLTYTVVDDLYRISGASARSRHPDACSDAPAVAVAVFIRIFRGTVLGLLMILCIKLQASYLQSDGANIVDWLLSDARSVLGLHADRSGSLGQQALANFSSFLLLFTTVAVFLFCLQRILRVARENQGGGPQPHVPWSRMKAVVGLLVTSFFLIGGVTGFSVVLAISTALALYCLFDPLFANFQTPGELI